MKRILLVTLCGLMLTSCNEHAVDECLPACSTNQRNQQRFAECVADGNEDCRAGNRRCCAIDVGCAGDLGDQRVVAPADCIAIPQNSCLPGCDDEDELYYEDCLAGLTSADCSPGDEQCCANDTGCLGTLGDVSVFAVDRNCCDDDEDCLREELCDGSVHECISADCGVTGFCPEGLECIEDECICRDEGARCSEGHYCIDGECVEDPCLSCPAGTVCDPSTLECVTCASEDATCDLVDDDCDGAFDEDYIVGFTCGVGVCTAPAAEYCVDGAPVREECTPMPPTSSVDVCDTLDADCDGAVDEDCGVCGVGVLDAFEDCDGMDLGGFDCTDIGFDRGMLACFSDCTFDYELCTCDADTDEDGDCDSHDCAVRDPNRGQFNFELCDLVDNDCDGFTDELPDASDSCDDFTFCNGVETCSVGSCVSAPMGPCDDGNDCTRDPCNEAAASCGAHTPESPGFPCDPGSGSPGMCDGMGTCLP